MRNNFIRQRPSWPSSGWGSAPGTGSFACMRPNQRERPRAPRAGEHDEVPPRRHLDQRGRGGGGFVREATRMRAVFASCVQGRAGFGMEIDGDHFPAVLDTKVAFISSFKFNVLVGGGAGRGLGSVRSKAKNDGHPA